MNAESPIVEHPMTDEVLLIGVGNEFRGDDALGIAVAQEFRSRGIPGLKVRIESGEGASLMQAWTDANRVLIVDAMSSDESPGTVHRLDVSQTMIPHQYFHSSSHTFGVAEAIEVARELHQLPSSLIVYGIVGEDFSVGHPMSSRVQSAIPGLVSSIEEDVLRISF